MNGKCEELDDKGRTEQSKTTHVSREKSGERRCRKDNTNLEKKRENI